MARKTKTITIPAAKPGDPVNRDTGKIFVITELSAFRVEKWAQRTMAAMIANGLDLPDELTQLGTAGVAIIGFRNFIRLNPFDAQPLLDEMMECVQFQPDRSNPQILRPVDEYDVEEVSTLMLLRSEVVELHTGFSLAAFLSDLGKAAKTMGAARRTNDIETSPNSSETSSEQEKPV